MWAIEDHHVGKIIRTDNIDRLTIRGPSVTAGLAFVVFNPRDTVVTISSQIEKTYKAADTQVRSEFQIKPKGLANVLYVAEDMVVISGDVL
jgi:hypothetical protein